MSHGAHHTGKISRHHFKKHSGKHAHKSHHAMNKMHGTPDGMDADDHYGDHNEHSGVAKHHGHQSQTAQYYGHEGQGVPGSMANNDTCY